MELASNIIIKPELRRLFQNSLPQYRVLFFSAPCGFGKTTTVSALLEEYSVLSLNGAANSLPMTLDPGCEFVLLDDLQLLEDGAQQEKLCDWIRMSHETHFVLLSRGAVPGWLQPFQFSDMLRTIDNTAFLWERSETEKYLALRNVTVSPSELSAIQTATKGYPLALALLCNQLENGEIFAQSLVDRVRQALFLHFEAAVYRPFEPPMRQLLISLSPFPNFDSELAQMVSGEIRAGEQLSWLRRNTTMLFLDGHNRYRFWDVFRQFLLWELTQEYSLPEQQAIYSRAGLYYELHSDYGSALDCYDKSGQHRKVSELLVKNAELHPGLGHYYDMERYYYAMPEDELLRSPPLMCGMSMLTAMNMDFEASEHWYSALNDYASRLKPSDAEYQAVRGKLVFLDISLPQRGIDGLAELMLGIFDVLANKQIKIPSFSVTSTLPSILNGGKDFSPWSKQDDLLYDAIGSQVAAVLGRDGVGLADCAICESKFEKGEDISQRLLSLLSRQSEIYRKGTADIAFAIIGLLARSQVSQGKAAAALKTLENLREEFTETGAARFLPNLDAMRCRIWLRLGQTDQVDEWLREKAPKSVPRMRAMWRYRYQTAAMVHISREEYDEAQLLIAPLIPYCTACSRTLDELHLRLLMAICLFRSGSDRWQTELYTVLDTAVEYQYIRPISQYGAAILPLLTACDWEKDRTYFDRLLSETRQQTVNYPAFLRPIKALFEPLSPAEKQVLRLLCHDLSNQEIADTLGVKLATVKTHINHILQKMNVRRRSEAKTAAEALHLI